MFGTTTIMKFMIMIVIQEFLDLRVLFKKYSSTMAMIREFFFGIFTMNPVNLG